MLKKISIATSNDKKVEGIRNVLGIEVEKVQLDLPEIQSVDIKEVVSFSAKDAYSKTKIPVLVNDTGLFVEAWNGLPGALITWFTKYTVGVRGMLKMLESEENRRVTAKTAYAFYDGKEVRIFEGKVDGVLTREERGNNGFEWDTIFLPNGYKKTFAEMTPSEKDAVPYYRTALYKLKDYIDNTAKENI